MTFSIEGNYLNAKRFCVICFFGFFFFYVNVTASNLACHNNGIQFYCEMDIIMVNDSLSHRKLEYKPC